VPGRPRSADARAPPDCRAAGERPAAGRKPVLVSPRRRLVLVLPLLLVAPARASPSEDEISRLLDRFHRAASAARFDEYFGTFAPDGVFIGTDAGERWTVDQFKAYAKPHFDQGRGWTYVMVERHINVSTDGRHASFDELLDNAGLGRCRGTGVVRRVGADWKIEQYHLTIPIPNELAGAVVQRIRTGK
jgi:hypothetical protein